MDFKENKFFCCFCKEYVSARNIQKIGYISYLLSLIVVLILESWKLSILFICAIIFLTIENEFL